LLVATAGPAPAREKAETIVEVAADLVADIVLTYITDKPSLVHEREGEASANIYETCTEGTDVDLELVIEYGDVVSAIERVVDRENCGAVVIGGPPPSVWRTWRQAEVGSRARRRLDVPIVTVPDSLAVDPHEIEAARRHLDDQQTEAHG
jgi:nucleotide-binding universal stress UspA family protein